MQFAPKHVVTMVVALSCAVVLAPVGVMAATGTLVNITDPFDSSRKARVGKPGTLHVEQRAGVNTGAASRAWSTNQLNYYKLAEAVGPERIAVTEVTAHSHGPTSGETYGHNYIDIVAYTQQSGSHPCGTPSAYVDYSVRPGYTKTLLRRILVRNQQQSVQFTWNGPSLVVPAAAAGKRSCVQLEVSLLSTGTTLWFGGTAYKY